MPHVNNINLPENKVALLFLHTKTSSLGKQTAARNEGRIDEIDLKRCISFKPHNHKIGVNYLRFTLISMKTFFNNFQIIP